MAVNLDPRSTTEATLVDVVEAEADEVVATKKPAQRKGGLAGAAVGASLASAVLPITSLLTGPILARALGPDGRGIMAAVLGPVFVLQFVAGMGLPEAATYAVARLKVPPRRVVFIVGRLAVIYGILAALVVIAVAPMLLRKSPEAVAPLRIAICTLPLLMLTIIQRFATQGSRNFRLSNTERVTSSMTRFIGIVGLAGLGWLTAPSAIAVNVVTTIGGGVLLGAVMFSQWGKLALPAPDPPVAEPPHLTRVLAAYGFRGAGGVMANLVNWRLDQAIMVALVSTRQLGLYAVAVSLAELPQTVFAQIRNIMFAEASARDDLGILARATRTMIAITGTCAVLGIIAAPEAIKLLFGHAFVDATGMAQILFVGSVPFSCELVLASGLLSLGFPGRRSLSPMTAAIVTLVGLFVLTPHIGAIGAAWTSLAAYTTNFFFTLVMFVRLTGISPRDILFVKPQDIRWLYTQMSRLLRGLRRKLKPRRA